MLLVPGISCVAMGASVKVAKDVVVGALEGLGQCCASLSCLIDEASPLMSE